MVTQLHIQEYSLLSHIIMLYHKGLDIVPSATQQDFYFRPALSNGNAKHGVLHIVAAQ